MNALERVRCPGRRSIITGAGAACLALGALGAQAHHSFAMFDREKTVTLEGTFKLAELSNPHAWYWVVVSNADGTSDTWGAEGGGPATVSGVIEASGLSARQYFAPGQKVTLMLHPLKDGRKGGELVSLRFADGRVFPPPAADSATRP